MEKSLIQLAEKNDHKGLKKKLEKANLSQVFKNIRQVAMSGKKETITLLRALFLGSPPDNDECVRRRVETYKFAINLLQSSNMNSRLGTEVVAELLFATDQFPTSSLMKLADILVDLVKDCTTPGVKWLEVVPKVLSSLASRDSVVYNGSEMSGADFKSQVVNAICTSRWESSCAVQFGSMLRNVPLSSKEVDFVTEKLLRTLSDVGIHEIPPLVYQLLLLAAKGHQKQVMLGILQFFINQDNKLRGSINMENEEDCDRIESSENHESLRYVEGTVILHIVYTARQDQNLGKEFIKIIKSAQHNAEFVLAPFTFSVALSLAKTQRYEEQILDILKGAVLRMLREQEKKCQSYWMRSIIPHDPDLFVLVSEAIKDSKYGWDHVTQGLVLFGFTLLDSFGPKGAFGRVSTKSNASASDRACVLGAHILKETFKVHNSVRSEIFEQILNRIIMKSSKPVLHYIDVLTKTVHSAPQLLLEILAKLMEIMDHLPFLPHANAVSVLQSLTPLLKISMPLKDTLMIVLRKALFNRELEARKIAVSGYLIVMKNLKVMGNVSLSQSQNSQSSAPGNVQIDVHTRRNGVNSEAVCLEIMGTLKRALMLQAEVRQLLYEGLYDVVIRNKRIVDIVLELLFSQFEKFYDGSGDCTQPLKLNLCIKHDMSDVVLQEPIADLLTAIHLCLAEEKHRCNSGDSDDDDDSDNQQSSRAMLELSFKTLTEKILKCEAEDFELDKAADFSKDSAVGARNKLTITLLLGVYETLMEYSHTSHGNYSTEMCEEILELHHKYLNINDMIQEKKQNKGHKMKKKDVRTINSHLTMRFVSNTISALFCNSDSEQQSGIGLLKSNKDFVEYIVGVCHQKLSKYKESGRLDGFSSSMENKFDYLCKIGQAYLTAYADDFSAGSESEQCDYSFYFIEGLNIIFSIIFADYMPKVSKFLEQLDETITDDTDITAKFLEKFKSLTITLLADTGSDVNLKKLSPLLSIIGSLWEHLPPTSKYKSDTCVWIKQLCSDQAIKDSALARSLLCLYFNINHEVQGSVTILRDIAFDIHYHLGDVEEDTEISGEREYEVINAKTANSALPLLLLNAEKVLDEVDWVLNVMKARVIASTEPSEVLKQDISSREENEVKVCIRLGHVTTLLCEVIQTAVPRGNVSNSVLKIVTRFYSLLGDVAKYYLNVYKYKVGVMINKFEKVVKLSGTQLTSQVYAFITYIQSTDGEDTGARNKPKKTDVEVQKAFREIKTVPPLIFAIELYEKLLIQLSKKSKVNLMAHIKLSTSRDFRIQSDKVEAALEQQSDSDATDAEDAENVNPSSNRTVSSDTSSSSSRRGNGRNQSSERNVSQNGTSSRKRKDELPSEAHLSPIAHASKKRSHTSEEQSSTSRLSLPRKRKSK